MRSSGLPAALRWILVGSGVVHFLFVVAVAVSAAASNHSIRPPQTAITAKLVRLGKKRDKELLPRKIAPKPPPPKKAAPVLAPQPSAPAAPTPTPKSATDRLKEIGSVTDALNRMKKTAKEDEPEGDPEGTADGDASSLTQALIGNRYMTEVYRCVKSHYAIEGIPPRKIVGRKALVLTRINEKGKLFDFRIEKSSGLRAFDRAVERAVKRCGRVSPPPKEILRQVRDDGIEFEFRP